MASWGQKGYLRIIRHINRGPDPRHPFSLDLFPWIVGSGERKGVCLSFAPTWSWIQGQGSSWTSKLGGNFTSCSSVQSERPTAVFRCLLTWPSVVLCSADGSGNKRAVRNSNHLLPMAWQGEICMTPMLSHLNTSRHWGCTQKPNTSAILIFFHWLIQGARSWHPWIPKWWEAITLLSNFDKRQCGLGPSLLLH